MATAAAAVRAVGGKGYARGGKMFPSVTTVLSVLDKPGTWRVARSGGARADAGGHRFGGMADVVQLVGGEGGVAEDVGARALVPPHDCLSCGCLRGAAGVE